MCPNMPQYLAYLVRLLHQPSPASLRVGVVKCVELAPRASDQSRSPHNTSPELDDVYLDSESMQNNCLSFFGSYFGFEYLWGPGMGCLQVPLLHQVLCELCKGRELFTDGQVGNSHPHRSLFLGLAISGLFSIVCIVQSSFSEPTVTSRRTQLSGWRGDACCLHGTHP